MTLIAFLGVLVGLLCWAVWVMAAVDAVGRSPDKFTRGSKALWLAVLFLVPTISGLAWMAPMVSSFTIWPPGDLLFSLVWIIARFGSWYALPIFPGMHGELLWLIVWVIGLITALAYLWFNADRKLPVLGGGVLDVVTIVLAINTSLAVGMIIMLASGANPVAAYGGLFEGMIGDRSRFADTMVAMTPFLFMGLAVSVGFMTGLFNIGAEGQFYAGSVTAAVVGSSITNLPWFIHLPITILAGLAAGMVWGAIPGFLKAKFGAHEVINTIMMNYIAVKSVDYLVKNVVRDPTASLDRTRFVAETAQLPVWVTDTRLHLGFWLAIAAVAVIWWLMFKTTWGFEMRTVGAGPGAARYAGISVPRNIVLAMAIGGMLSGLAGTSEVIGLNRNLPAAFTSGAGFDSIAVALLAKSSPLGVIPAAFLWGGLRNGAGLMQVRAGISRDLIDIVQALVILFVAAPQIVRFIYRIRAERVREVVLTRGWGK